MGETAWVYIYICRTGDARISNWQCQSPHGEILLCIHEGPICKILRGPRARPGILFGVSCCWRDLEDCLGLLRAVERQEWLRLRPLHLIIVEEGLVQGNKLR